MQAIEHSDKDGETIPRSIRVEFVSPNIPSEPSQNSREGGADNSVQAWPIRQS